MDLSAVYDFLKFTDAIIGKKGTIVLDTNILGWAAKGDEYDQKKDILIIGEQNKPITYADVSRTFHKIQNNPKFQEAFESRSFVFEGVKYDKPTHTWQICWGS